MKKTAFALLTLLFATSAFAKGYLQNSDFKSLSDLQSQSPPAGAAQLLNTDKIYDITNAQQLSTSIANGDLGGSAGGGGVVLNLNTGFEKQTTSWTASGGTFTTTTTAANVGFGARAGSWDASANAQTLSNASVTVPSGLYGKTCSVSWYYKGGDSNLKMQVYDGTNVIAESSAFTAQTGFSSKQVMFFTCPSSGSMLARLIASGDAAIVYIDDVKLGQETLFSVSASGVEGRLNYPGQANCNWSNTAPATMTSYAADTDCATPTVSGNLQAPGTKIPGFVLPNAKVGVEYIVLVNGSFNSSSGGERCIYRLSDGTDSSQIFTESGAAGSAAPFDGGGVARLSFSTAGSKTVQIQSAYISATSNCQVDASDTKGGLEFVVIAENPNTTEAVSVDKMGWRIDANIGGANPSLGTSSVSSYSEITNGSLDMVLASGSASAEIPCSTTNASSGLTCSAGSESVGVAFVPPFAGTYEVCAYATHSFDVNSSARLEAMWQLVETPNNAQTILQEGGGKVGTGVQPGTGLNKHDPLAVCGTFLFADTAKKTIRLMYELNAAATISTNILAADRSASVGQRDIKITVRPRVQYADSVKFSNLATTSRLNGVKIEAITFGGAGGAATACTADPCTVSQNTGAYGTVTRNGTGDYSVAITGGFFSGRPTCTTAKSSTGNFGPVYGLPNSAGSSITILSRNLANTSEDAEVSIVCVGF